MHLCSCKHLFPMSVSCFDLGDLCIMLCYVIHTQKILARWKQHLSNIWRRETTPRNWKAESRAHSLGTRYCADIRWGLKPTWPCQLDSVLKLLVSSPAAGMQSCWPSCLHTWTTHGPSWASISNPPHAVTMSFPPKLEGNTMPQAKVWHI